MAHGAIGTEGLQIYVIGGGGFTHEGDQAGNQAAIRQSPSRGTSQSPNRGTGWADAILEDRLLAIAPANPKIGFIGHASSDESNRIARFYERFQGLAKTSHLPITGDSEAAQAFIAALDILYVGGGATLKMLHHWRQMGLDQMLIDAAHRGMILSGVSAGAICWFDQLLLSDTGNGNNRYVHATGLGLLGGSACPHYHNEAPRKAAFDGQIAAGNISAGLGIDDGVGVHICRGSVRDIVRAGSGDAFMIERRDDEATVTPLKIGQTLATFIKPRK